HLITLGIPDLKDASLTQKGVVQLSSSTTSVSEILAATPKAVKDMGDKALKTTNNLSEIAAAGSVAQATTQANIGLTPSKFSGRLLNTQTFTSTGTYTPTTGTGYIIVEAVVAAGHQVLYQQPRPVRMQLHQLVVPVLTRKFYTRPCRALRQ
ncbi:TPA: phage tail protein, partial [Yersinia enterocolitica]